MQVKQIIYNPLVWYMDNNQMKAPLGYWLHAQIKRPDIQ